jgi:hypothetical protein
MNCGKCRPRGQRCFRLTFFSDSQAGIWGSSGLLEPWLTGLLNQHPRTAIKFKEAELKGQKGDILNFFDTVTAEQ